MTEDQEDYLIDTNYTIYVLVKDDTTSLRQAYYQDTQYNFNNPPHRQFHITQKEYIYFTKIRELYQDVFKTYIDFQKDATLLRHIEADKKRFFDKILAAACETHSLSRHKQTFDKTLDQELIRLFDLGTMPEIGKLEIILYPSQNTHIFSWLLQKFKDLF